MVGTSEMHQRKLATSFVKLVEMIACLSKVDLSFREEVGIDYVNLLLATIRELSGSNPVANSHLTRNVSETHRKLRRNVSNRVRDPFVRELAGDMGCKQLSPWRTLQSKSGSHNGVSVAKPYARKKRWLVEILEGIHR